MAVQASPANGAAEKRTRAKKDDAPVFVEFINSKNERLKRIPEDIDKMLVSDRSKRAVNFSIGDISLPMLKQLAADALRRRFKSLKEGDKGILEQANEIFTFVKSGKLYARVEGAPRPGRTFDVEIWVSALTRAAQIVAEAGKGKPFTKKQIDDLRSRLEGMSSSERKVATAKWNSNAVVKRAILEVKAARAQKAAISDDAVDLLSF